MKSPEEEQWVNDRARIIGLGETSARKSYYSELQRHIDELKASEADLRTLFDNTHDAIFIHDFDGRVVDVNQSTLHLYRVTREEALAYSIRDYSSERITQAQLDAFLSRVRTDGFDHVFEWEARRPKDGSVFPVEVALHTVLWRGKQMVVALVRDISERLEAERERRRLEDQVAQLKKMDTLGQLAGGIAHDFNNMLTPILNYSMLLRDDIPTDDPRWADLNEVVQSALRARDLTRQLLAFARKQTLALKRVDLNQVVHGFERMLRRTLREDILIDYELTPHPSFIDGDIGQLEQVLLNLAINAQDAMPKGGHLVIRTLAQEILAKQGTTPPGTYACLTVSDNGHGMDEATLKQIFEPFFTTKGLGRGTGLGLSTVYGIAQQHGAFIEVKSKPGEGTSFEILFPVKDKETPPSGAPSLGAAKANRGTVGTILLVEDQDHVRASTKGVLERGGGIVLCARNADEALAMARASLTPIDLLISDVIMEGLNGGELYRRLSEAQPSLKALFISGYPDDVISRHGILESGVQFLAKPFTPAELLTACHKARNLPPA